MRIIIISIAVGLSLFAAEWVYRCFLRPVDQPTEQMLALAQHFNSNGIIGHIHPVRHGFRHSQVIATASYEISGYPLPISFEQCPNEIAAEAQLKSIQISPNLMHAKRNGLLVMCLPMWGKDTEQMAKKVTEAFTLFKTGT